MGYNKLLIARNSPENNCYAVNGEWLIVGQEEHKMKVRLPEDHHYFVGAESKQPSRYGWVHEMNREITPEELAERYSADPSAELVDSCKLLLDAVKKQESGTPMACTYSTTGVLKKEKVLKIHKIIFYEVKGSEAFKER